MTLSFSSDECSFIQLPRKRHSDKDTLFSLVSAEFDLQVYVSDACSSCYGRGGLCELEQNGKFHCAIADKGIYRHRITQNKIRPTCTQYTYIENACRVLCI